MTKQLFFSHLNFTSVHFFHQLDRYDGSGPAVSPNAISYGADGYDVVDSTPDPQRTKQAIAQLQQKILKLTEQIKIEQTARDDNVAEYLKLANNADKQQSARIKQVFEKKNQKSAQTIQQLQRKLEHYHRKLREVEHNGIPRQPKDVFRDMHQGLKDVGAKVCASLVLSAFFCCQNALSELFNRNYVILLTKDYMLNIPFTKMFNLCHLHSRLSKWTT